MTTPVPLILTPEELARLLAKPNQGIVLLDATYLYKPDPATRDAHAEYVQRRLPHARFWSLADVSEPHPLGFKLMLPSPERFAQYASSRGIAPEDHVVVYDTVGAFSGPRTVFTFLVRPSHPLDMVRKADAEAFGHEKVSLLNGGLPAAVDAGFTPQSGEPSAIDPTTYPVRPLRPGFITSFEDVQEYIQADGASSEVLVDARGEESYKAGHIPSSYCLPWQQLLESVPRHTKDGLLPGKLETYSRIPSLEALQAHLEGTLSTTIAGDVLAGRRKVINSTPDQPSRIKADQEGCGGGLSAAIVWLTLRTQGIESSLYDESWSGYSARPDVVVAK